MGTATKESRLEARVLEQQSSSELCTSISAVTLTACDKEECDVGARQTLRNFYMHYNKKLRYTPTASFELSPGEWSPNTGDQDDDGVTVRKMEMDHNEGPEEDGSSGLGDTDKTAPLVACVSSRRRGRLVMESSEK